MIDTVLLIGPIVFVVEFKVGATDFDRAAIDQVWDYDFGGDAGIVESYVSYLRRKVDTTEPKMIRTVRGVGYSLRPPRS